MKKEHEYELFCRYIRGFLEVYLLKQRNLSPNTVRSCRTALNLFVDYLSPAKRKRRRKTP